MMRIKTLIGKLTAALVLVAFIAAGCGDSASSNGDAAEQSEIESRWAAIVEIATNPNPLDDAQVQEFKSYIIFPFTVGGRINDDPYEEEIITEEEFDESMAFPDARGILINSMVQVSVYDVAGVDQEADIRVSGNSATRTVTISVPSMPDLDLGTHVSNWVRIDGEWYVRGVDLFIKEPTF